MIRATLPLSVVGGTMLAPLCEHCGMVHALYIIDVAKGTITTFHPARPLSLAELREATEGIRVVDFADVGVAGE